MKKQLKKLGIGVATYSLVCQVLYAQPLALVYDGKVHNYELAPISLYINNEPLEQLVMPPIQLEGTTLVPAREVFCAIGANVDWKSQEKKVYIDQGETLIVLEINSYEAWVNGEIKSLSMPAKIINDKVMLPLRFISETLGYNVEWLGLERHIYIDVPVPSNEPIAPPEDLTEDLIEGEQPGQEHEETLEEEEEISQDASQLFESLSYESDTQTLRLKKLEGMSALSFTVDDLYRERKLVVTLNGIFTEGLPAQTWQGDGLPLKQLTVVHEDTTKLIIETQSIHAVTLSEDGDTIAIRLQKPREKYDKIVVLDPGHGGDDGGTSLNGIYEKNLTLSYSNVLLELLEQDADIKVYTTRAEDLYATTNEGLGKQYPPLDSRPILANEIEPDLYISIHVNSYTNTNANGIETFYYNDPLDLRGQTFAKMVQSALVNEFAMTDRTAKTAQFVVIKNTNAPAILIETGFLTNEKDRMIITDYTYPERFAQQVYGCILDYYNMNLHRK